jgi:hypothetical protein
LRKCAVIHIFTQIKINSKMSNLKNNDPSMFILSTHRIMFPHLDVPHKFEGDDDDESNEPKFDCTWLIPVNHPDAAALMGAMQQIHAAEALSKFKGMPFSEIGMPDGIWCPLRSGDQYADKMVARGKDATLYEAYRGHYFIKATSGADKPITVFQQLPGQGRIEVIDIKKELYGGCYARGVLKIIAWANKGKYGFSCFINSVLKTQEGPRLGGGNSANVADYDLGADSTDHSQLLAGDVVAQPEGYAMPGMPQRATTPGVLPTMPGGAVPPAAQRAPLPGMLPPVVPGAGVYQAPVPQMALPPVYTAPPVALPVMAPAAPAPMYGEWEGKKVASFDNGVTWEYVA